MKSFKAVLSICLALAASAIGQEASPKPASISVSGKSGPMAFDLKALEALPQVSFRAADPWDGMEHAYSGVLILDILGKAGLSKDAAFITVKALNGYEASIRLADLRKHRYILAYRLDGLVMAGQASMRKYGAFMVAIDFRNSPDLDKEVAKNQLVWQVTEIEAR